MNPMLHLRKNVFRASQIEMARIAGVSQPTVSKWEAGIQTPLSTAYKRIRAYAKRRGIPWNDAWLFGEEAA
jgi:DNA-binding transcriptional regulator YiaG